VECALQENEYDTATDWLSMQVYDFINSELTHNKTYAYRLPPTFIEQARGFADFHENGVFSDKDMKGIGNSSSFIVDHAPDRDLICSVVAGRTILHSILKSLERISFNGDPLQFLLIETTYQPFISLFHQTEMIQEHPELAAIRQ
jgi:hypothetical protein